MTEAESSVNRPPFVVHRNFIETPFEERFQKILRHAWKARSWHVISAVPGSGKSLGIDDLVNYSGAYKDSTGKTYLPILAIRAPENAAREQALGIELSAAFGIVPTMTWAVRRNWLVEIMHSTGVECIIIDDAHDLTRAQLALLKKLTDNLAASPYHRQISLCLVTAHSGNVIPLRDIITTPELVWRQFYRRMDTEQPFCVVDGHTQEEVANILTTFEDLYHDQLPHLRLRRWSKPIFEILTNPILDLDSSHRVTMDHLTRLVTSAIRRVYDRGEIDLNMAILQETADLMILRRNDTYHVDNYFIDDKPRKDNEAG
jgi:hypothetical protein